MKQLKSALIRVAVFIVLFFIAYNIFNNVLNRGNTDLTADIPSASLPVVYMNVNNMKINALHGYTTQMEGNYLRGQITPINADRTLDIEVDTFGTSIAKVGYEVRNLDCTRLIENQELDTFEFEDNIITAKLSFKDLIDDDKEYMLIVKLTNGNGEIYSYYARIINTTELALVDKIGFCIDFSDKTFDQGKAPELKKYMESNSRGDNSSYAHVDIHSNYNQLSWGNLHPELIGNKDINLISIDSVNACVELLYRVKIKDEFYNVSEYFRVRKGTERMYLMEYDRTMNQIITNEEKLVINGKIINGIVNEQIHMMESSDNGVVAFVQQDSLYSLNTQTGNLARVFSFRDIENDDARTNFNGSDIKILSLDEVGNISFIVYGYMTRGRHEGQVGVGLYKYDSVVNNIEEKMFIPYTKSYEILKKDIEKLSYINSRNQMFILMDGTVYSIDLETNETETIASNLDENRFVSSTKNNTIAWQTGDSIRDFTSIQFYSLEQSSPKILNSGPGAIIVPLGFIGDDLIYGTADTSDITLNQAGRTVIPMYKVTIESIDGDVLKEYSKQNVYVTDAELSDEMVKLSRISKAPDGSGYYEIDEDQILNSANRINTDNVYKSVVTEEMETTYQIVLAKEMKSGNVKVLTPKEILSEDNHGITLQDKDTKDRYYAYAKGYLTGIYTDSADAVIDAEEQFGVVVNKKMSYVWESGHGKASVKLETVGGTAITEEQMNSGVTPLAICIEEMLEYKEVYKDVDTLFDKSNTAISVLKENFPNMEVLDLSGCSLDSVLYYVSKGYPVLAMTEGNSAALIVGYDTKNTILYSPITGETYKMGLNDSREYFESCGNRYVGYID